MARRMRMIVALVVLVAALTPTIARAETWWPPVPGPVVRDFEPPAEVWLAGHRGVDLSASVGDAVRAAGPGRVAFAGLINGRGVIVVTHGDVRTTYEPVTAQVSVGASVLAGEVLGRLDAGHPCGVGTCLHWGLKRGDVYLDPRGAIDEPDLLLLPASAEAAARQAAADRGAAGSGVLSRPVPGPITSRYGMRFHPIFHEWRLHSGVDFRADCGTPIRAAQAGRVVSVSYDSSGGHRLVLGHPGGLTTHYLHAQRYRVRQGSSVARGEVVGWVGSTGWSTGCHLHFTVKSNGRLIDPARLL